VNTSRIHDLQGVRQAIDAAMAAGDFMGARAAMGTLEGAAIDPGLASFIISRFERMKTELGLRPFKLAVLRSFTIEPVVAVLRAAGLLAGLDLEVRLGGFNTYSQELLEEQGWLAEIVPDAVLIAVQGRDVAPALWTVFADLDESRVREQAREVVETYRQLIAAYLSRQTAPVIIHNFELPAQPANGVYDAQREGGQVATFDWMNRELLKVAREFKNVYVLDYDGLVRRRGGDSFYDPLKWATARMPLAAGEWTHLAREWLRFLCPLSGRICKALAVDLDNTLWGGVVGEDGPDGIKLDENYPGAAYRAVQRAMLDLHRRGILLAICSKNNPADAMEMIDRHEGMLLRREHFAATRINWADKAQNLREIARELNIGIDSIAFLDDNPAERDWVRRQVPEVTVIELPADPMGYAGAIRGSPVFERLELSAEDRQRGAYVAGQRARQELRESGGTLEDFYRSLEMRVQVDALADATLTRAAQLTQKTNQFNLTTCRYTEQQLSGMTAPDWAIFTFKAEDRFGSNGIVGLAILKFEKDAAVIDTFLLSCRVIGRTIETAFLAALAQFACGRGAARLAGWYVPTTKNLPARDFYPSHGFQEVAAEGGKTRWEIALPAPAIKCPDWIQCRMGADERAMP
jgi:FkbH-like protein